MRPNKISEIWSAVVVAGMLISGPISGLAVTDHSPGIWHVSPKGNDGDPGTRDHPLKTIQRAIHLMKPGDIVQVGAGVYQEQVILKQIRGDSGRKTILQGEGTGKTIIDGATLKDNQWTPLVHVVDSDFVRIDGFEIRNSFGNNLLVEESTHVELTRLDVHHSRGNGGIEIRDQKRPDLPAFNHVWECESHHNYRGGIAVYYSASGFHLIEKNRVFKNQCHGNYDGIQAGSGSGGCHHVVIRNNQVYDNGNQVDCLDQIDAGGHGVSDFYLVEGNDIYFQNGIGRIKVHGSLWNSEGKLSSGNPPRYEIVRQNRLTNVGASFYTTPCPATWYHNTFVGKGMAVSMDVNPEIAASKPVADGSYSYGDQTFTGGDTGRLNFKNNLFYQINNPTAIRKQYLMQFSNGKPGVDVRPSSLKFSSNLYHFAQSGAIIWRKLVSSHPEKWGSEMTFGSPMNEANFSAYQNANEPDRADEGSILTHVSASEIFVDASSKDYRLTENSPAIDKGSPLTRAVNDAISSSNLKVDRATYFQDGWGGNGEWLVDPDMIQIGDQEPVAIERGGIDPDRHEIRLSHPMTWKAGDTVSLPFEGPAPDIGAFERKN